VFDKSGSLGLSLKGHLFIPFSLHSLVALNSVQNILFVFDLRCLSYTPLSAVYLDFLRLDIS